MSARKIFRSVDGDGNGRLDRTELGVLVQELRKSMGLDYLNAHQVPVLPCARSHISITDSCGGH